MAFISGQYTATWNAQAIGQTRDGFRLSHQIFKRLITGDSYGDTPQDAIYRGAEAHIGFSAIAYDSAAIQAIKWPYNAAKWTLGTIGTTDVGSSLAKSLVLTAVASTPAAATPATLTAALTALAENFPVEVLFAPDLREVPLRLRIYPNSGVFAVET